MHDIISVSHWQKYLLSSFLENEKKYIVDNQSSSTSVLKSAGDMVDGSADVIEIAVTMLLRPTIGYSRIVLSKEYPRKLRPSQPWACE